jgi:uncharacterized membrane protein
MASALARAAARAAPPPLASWELLRNHALTPVQFLGCFGVPALLLAVFAATAAVLGFWPITWFCASQIVALSAGFAYAAMHVIDGERLTLHAGGMLEVLVTDGTTLARHRFNVAWTRLERRTWGPARRPSLWLVSGAQCVRIGSQATPQALARTEAELARILGRHGHWSWKGHRGCTSPEGQTLRNTLDPRAKVE